jgi:hypothetical protein
LTKSRLENTGLTFMPRVTLFYRAMKRALPLACLFLLLARGEAQIQIDLRLKRSQYIAYEPVTATLAITNLAGRGIDLHNADGQPWFGLEVTGSEGQPIAPVATDNKQLPLKIEAGERVTQKINLTLFYPVHDAGTYRVRAHVYFADTSNFFYSRTTAFEVTDARPIWQKTVGIPEWRSGSARTYSLLTNRFPDHTSLYVRVENKNSGIVYATYSLGRAIAFNEPQAELDRANQLHVLHCAAPRSWAYSRVGLNGELLERSSFMEMKTRPRLFHAADGAVAVRGGMLESPAAPSARNRAPKLSDRPPKMPKDD